MSPANERSIPTMKKETLGTKIAARRKELGLTQLELANQMGVTDKAVSKWERELSCPDVDSLPRLAEILGLSLDELMQIKTDGDKASDEEQPLRHLLSLLPRAVCLAMGVAVAVLTILGELETPAALTMLAIGLACAGVALLEKK